MGANEDQNEHDNDVTELEADEIEASDSEAGDGEAGDSEAAAPPPVPTVSVVTDQKRDFAVILPEMDGGLMAEVAPPPMPAEGEEGGPAQAAEAGAPDREAADFFRVEARALPERQPERAALMWVEAAAAAERAGEPVQVVRDDLDQALELMGQSESLLARTRRMMIRIGSYEMGIKLGQREAKIGGDPAIRAALLLEAAAVVRYHLHKPEVARQILQQALDVQPHYVPALAMSAELCQQLKLHEEACQHLERLADNLTHPRERALSLYAAGLTRLRRLGDQQTGPDLLRRALEAEPMHLPACAALVEHYRLSGQWPELCHVLEHQADIVEQPAVRGPLLLEAGSIRLDRNLDLAAASRDLSRAARALPESRDALRRLAEAYRMEGRTRQAIEALRQLEALVPDAQRKASLLTQIGGMHVSLNEPDKAAAAYREALELIPGYIPAIQDFGALCHRRGDYEGLVSLGQKESESTLPAPARAVRYIELAEILDRELNRPEAAADAYQRAIELDPESHLAYWFLESLLRRNGWHADLAELAQNHAVICKDARTRAHLLLEAGRLQSATIGDVDLAIKTLQEAGEDSSPASVLFDLVELLADQRRHGELVELLLRHADKTSDPREAEDRRVWAAQVLEQHLDERARALTVLREVVGNNPRSYAAIHATGRILSHQGAWEDLVRLFHHELKTDPERPDTAVVLFRMGRILEEQVGNAKAAIGAYARALQVDPSYTPAVAPLEGLVRKHGEWAKLVEVLETHAGASSDRADAAAALGRAAEVAAWHLDDPQQADRLFAAALERDPHATSPLVAQIPVALRQRSWSQAQQRMEQLAAQLEPGEQLGQLQLALCQLKEIEQDQAPDLELYLQAQQGPFGHLLREEVLRAQRLLQSEQLANAVRQAGEDTADDGLAAAHLCDATLRHQLGGEEVDDVLQVVRSAYERRSDAATAWALERELLRAGRWSEIAALVEHQAQLELDREHRIQLLTQAGAAFWLAGDADDAARVSREALNFDAHCLPALRTLLLIARARQDHRDLAELTDRLAEASVAPENRLKSCMAAADLWIDVVQDRSRALASLSVALADDPNQQQAFTRAESLLREREDFAELSRLYQRRIRACDDPEELSNLRWRHAKLLRQDLQRPDRAIVELNELLQQEPDNNKALSTLADLHEELGHWSDAASTLELILQRSEDVSLRHDARMRLANLALDRLHDTRRARQALDEATTEVGDDTEVAKLRIRLAQTTGDWDDARKELERMADQADGGTKVWCLLQLSEVAHTGLRDAELGRSYVQQALRCAAEDQQALDGLRRHHLTGRTEKLRMAATLEETLGSYAGGAEAASLRRLLVRLLMEDIGDAEQAMPHIDQLLREAPESVELALLRLEALTKRGDAAEAVSQGRQLLQRDPRSEPVLRHMTRAAPLPLAGAAGSLLELLDHHLTAEEEQTMQRLAGLRAPIGALAPTALPRPVEVQHLDALLLALGSALAESHEQETGEVLSPAHPVTAAALGLARAAGVHDLQVQQGGRRGASVLFAPQLTIQVAPALATEPDGATFRLWVARALLLGPSGALLDQLDRDGRETLLDGLSGKRAQSSAGQRLRKAVLGRLPRRERKEAEQLMASGSLPGLVQLEQLRQGAERLAVVFCRQPGTAIRSLGLQQGVQAAEVKGSPLYDELARFSFSEEYHQLFTQIWGASS